jgi:hypothetical protein
LFPEKAKGTMSDKQDASSDDKRLNQILADYLQAIDAGQTPDRQRLFNDNPELADSRSARRIGNRLSRIPTFRL